MKTLKKLCGDDRARRAWLWLHARHQDDAESLEILEESEPGLRQRMSSYDAAVQGIADPRRRRDAYGKMLDRLTLVESDMACDCAKCAS